MPCIKFYLQLPCRILLCFSDTLQSDFIHSLLCILPRTHWLLDTLAFFNDSSLVYCCLKDIFFSSNLLRILRNLKFIDQLQPIEFVVCPSIFQNDCIDWYFFSLFRPNIPNNPLNCFLNCFFSSPLILLQNYISMYFWFIISIFNFVPTVSLLPITCKSFDP